MYEITRYADGTIGVRLTISDGFTFDFDILDVNGKVEPGITEFLAEFDTDVAQYFADKYEEILYKATELQK